MCDFKPGDEVICIIGEVSVAQARLEEGRVYTVADIVPLTWANGKTDPNDIRIQLVEATWDTGYPHIPGAYHPRRFRKVQPRDLSAWLKTAVTDTDHLNKPIKTPARPKVDALLKRVQSGAFG